MSPKRARVSEEPVENVSVNPWILAGLSSAVVVTVARAVGQYFIKRPTTALAVWQALVNELQEEVTHLRKRLDEVEARNATMVMAAEEREAALVVRLKAVKDANEGHIEVLYADLEKTRIRLSVVEEENKRLRAQITELREKTHGEQA